jgi:hypothetical protein
MKILSKILILCLMMICIIGCTEYSSSDSINQNNLNEKDSAPKIEKHILTLTENNAIDTDESTLEAKANALKYANPDYCLGISYDYLRSSCFEAVAIQERDDTICNKIEDTLMKRSSFQPGAFMFVDQCRNIVRATKEGDLKAEVLKGTLEGNQANLVSAECEGKPAIRESCYVDLAEDASNPEYCDFLSSDVDRCKQYIKYRVLLEQIKATGSIEDCDQINPDFYFRGKINYWCTAYFEKLNS